MRLVQAVTAPVFPALVEALFLAAEALVRLVQPAHDAVAVSDDVLHAVTAALFPATAALFPAKAALFPATATLLPARLAAEALVGLV